MFKWTTTNGGILMATVLDVAQYILEHAGNMSTWKLQKLVYYSQAWHLVWADQPLFEEKIEAWANGPVAPTLYEQHKGCFSVASIQGGDSELLTPDERESIDKIIGYYGKFNGQQLSDLTHQEAPWMQAREGMGYNERGNVEITKESLAEYYGSL
jgi:uncharacterized phage-associated protein